LNGAFFRPGETVSARAEEHGVGWLSLGEGYSIETYDGDGWTTASISPTQYTLLTEIPLGPGEAARCWNFPIPANAPSGRYRLVLEGVSLKQGRANDPARRVPLILSSEFQILPPF
jgi:hypothetical protein